MKSTCQRTGNRILNSHTTPPEPPIVGWRLTWGPCIIYARGHTPIAETQNQLEYQVHVSTRAQPNPRLPRRVPETPDPWREARLGPLHNLCEGSRAQARRGRGGRRVRARARPRSAPCAPPKLQLSASPPSSGTLRPIPPLARRSDALWRAGARGVTGARGDSVGVSSARIMIKAP